MKEGIPEEWRTSTITHIYKQKGDPLECNNFRGIKLLSHTLKLWERVVENRLRSMVNISERQYGFQPGKSTIQPLFCLQMPQEKHRWFGKDLHMLFVDLEKAYDRVPRELIWYRAGRTKEIEIEVGLHQGSALSPLLFVIIIDVITEEIDEGTPWAMLFADDLVLCDPDTEMMELRLERWRECMEKNGLKVSRARTEHLQTTEETDLVGMKSYMETEMVNLPTVPVLQISRINDRQKRRSQQIRGEQGSKGMVEMERTEWSDLRQESTNEIVDPDIPDSDSTDTAVRLRNVANVSQR